MSRNCKSKSGGKKIDVNQKQNESKCLCKSIKTSCG